MTERRTLQLLTLEHQFCIRCWMVGQRVRVYSAAERIGRSDRSFKARRRAATERHYREVHPEVPR